MKMKKLGVVLAAGVLAASDGRTGVMCALERMTNHPYVVESVLAAMSAAYRQLQPRLAQLPDLVVVAELAPGQTHTLRQTVSAASL